MRSGQAGEAGDDRVVGVLLEGLGSGLAELLGVEALGGQGGQQCCGLLSHRLLDQRELSQLWGAQSLLDVNGKGVDAALAAGPAALHHVTVDRVARSGSDAGSTEVPRRTSDSDRSSGLAGGPCPASGRVRRTEPGGPCVHHAARRPDETR